MRYAPRSETRLLQPNATQGRVGPHEIVMFTVALFLWAATATAIRCDTVELPAVSVVEPDSCAPATYRVYVERCLFPSAAADEINRAVSIALRDAIDYDVKVEKARA